MVRWNKQRSFPHGPGTRGLIRIMSVDECRGPPADTAEGSKVSVGCKRAEQGESKLETAKEGLPSGPVVRTLPSSAGATVPSPVRELRSHMPWGQKNKKQKQYCNKFNKDFKNSPLQKNFLFFKFLKEKL